MFVLMGIVAPSMDTVAIQQTFADQGIVILAHAIRMKAVSPLMDLVDLHLLGTKHVLEVSLGHAAVRPAIVAMGTITARDRIAILEDVTDKSDL